MDKEQMLMDYMAKDFVATDLQLFMDTHPDDKEGLKKYNEAVKCANEAKEKYTAAYGPLCKSCGCATDSYDWLTSEWPWENNCTHQGE